MDINQRNVFGDNIVNGPVDRTATPELVDDLVQQLEAVGAEAVSIHFAHDGETQAFVNELAPMLNARLPVVNVVPHGMSGIPRGAFLVEPPGEGTTGYLRIGTR